MINIYMLFLVSWNIYQNKKEECYNLFSKMSPKDDKDDTGDEIKIIGRWHHLGGGSGICICESSDEKALASWALNWQEMCDLTISSVIEDEPLREIIRLKFLPDDLKINCCC